MGKLALEEVDSENVRPRNNFSSCWPGGGKRGRDPPGDRKKRRKGERNKGRKEEEQQLKKGRCSTRPGPVGRQIKYADGIP